MFKAYFAASTVSNKIKRLRKDNRASVCYHSVNDNITLVRKVEILTNQATKSRCWLDWFINHFPGSEPDPNYCIIKFKTEHVSLWVNHENAEFTIDELLTVQSCCGLLCNSCEYKESPHNCGGCVETDGHPFHGECPVAEC